MKDIVLPNMLGIAPPAQSPWVVWSGSTPKLKPEAQKALFLLLQNRYPVMSASGTVANKSLAPGMDPNADLWTWVALTPEEFTALTGSAPPAQTVYDQIKTLDPSVEVLVVLDDLANALQGNAQPQLRYVIAKKAVEPGVIALINQEVAVVGPTPEAPSTAAAPAASSSLAKVALVGAAVVGAGALIFGGMHRRPAPPPRRDTLPAALPL